MDLAGDMFAVFDEPIPAVPVQSSKDIRKREYSAAGEVAQAEADDRAERQASKRQKREARAAVQADQQGNF